MKNQKPINITLYFDFNLKVGSLVNWHKLLCLKWLWLHLLFGSCHCRFLVLVCLNRKSVLLQCRHSPNFKRFITSKSFEIINVKSYRKCKTVWTPGGVHSAEQWRDGFLPALWFSATSHTFSLNSHLSYFPDFHLTHEF